MDLTYEEKTDISPGTYVKTGFKIKSGYSTGIWYHHCIVQDVVATISFSPGKSDARKQHWSIVDKVRRILYLPLQDLPLLIHDEDYLTRYLVRWRLSI